MERRATAISQARAETQSPVLLLDTGNFMTGLESDIERKKADFVARAMEQIRYDAVNVGHLDARRPRLAVSQYNLPDDGMPLTSGAFTYMNPDIGKSVFSYPSRILITRDNFRIGIIGHPMDDLDTSKLGIENDYSNNPQDLMQLIEDVSIKDGVQMIILMTDFAGARGDTMVMASRYSLASIVIAGESAQPDYQDRKSGPDVPHPLVIPRAAAWGRSLGVLDLDLSPTGGITAYTLRYVDLNDSVAKDPALAQMTQEYLDAINAPPTGVPELRRAGFVGTVACKECHEGEYEDWRTTRHAGAWATLEDTGRLNEASCVPCHSTGYSESGAFPARMVPFESRNVGCESCHGPGDVHIQYQRYEIYGSLTGEARAEGLTDPIVRTPPESVCRQCHVAPYDEGWMYQVKLDRIRHNRGE